MSMHDESVVIKRESVTLRLFRTDDGLMLERELAEPSGNRLVQSMPVHSERHMQAFFSADPYYSQLTAPLGRITAKVADHLRQRGA